MGTPITPPSRMQNNVPPLKFEGSDAAYYITNCIVPIPNMSQCVALAIPYILELLGQTT